MSENSVTKALKSISIQTEGTELTMLSLKVNELQRENDRLKKIIAEYEKEESARSKIKTTEEIICIKALEDLREAQQSEPLTDKDAKAFGIFVEKLYQIRGKTLDHGNKKTFSGMDVDELLNVIDITGQK